MGGEQTTEDDPEEDEEMGEVEEIQSGQGEELRHGVLEYASSDEYMLRVIREKVNG